MYANKIPVKEYEKLAEEFNPTQFNAKAWVHCAKRAGMKYIVITAKHHDGFAMYHSRTDPFNIMDASPFGRDPLKELSEACRRKESGSASTIPMSLIGIIRMLFTIRLTIYGTMSWRRRRSFVTGTIKRRDKCVSR